jgi:hypothetical protein
MIRTLAIFATLTFGCGSSKRATPTREACTTYAQRTAELMYVGFERGSHGMGPYIKKEFIAAVATPLVPYCLEHLPPKHVTCVGSAATAADADLCLVDGALKVAMTPVLQQLVKDASKVADLPATATECQAAAKVVLAAMQPATGVVAMKLPAQEQIAALCVADHWTADFVRCTAANGVDCKATDNVKPGITKLVRETQLR